RRPDADLFICDPDGHAASKAPGSQSADKVPPGSGTVRVLLRLHTFDDLFYFRPRRQCERNCCRRRPEAVHSFWNAGFIPNDTAGRYVDEQNGETSRRQTLAVTPPTNLRERDPRRHPFLDDRKV